MKEKERKWGDLPTLDIILHTYLISHNKYFPFTSWWMGKKNAMMKQNRKKEIRQIPSNTTI